MKQSRDHSLSLQAVVQVDKPHLDSTVARAFLWNQSKGSVRLFLVTYLAVLSCFACEKKQGEGDGPREAIIDGRVDVEGIYPHVVLVGQGCTGTLVTPRHVLTAAHCVCDLQETADGGSKKDASFCQFTVETSFESTPDQPVGTVSGRVNVHPMFQLNFNPQGVITEGVADLAIITLDECAPTSVQPISLQDGASRLPTNGISLGRIVGFGKTTCDAESRAVDRWWGDAFVTSIGPEFLEISSSVLLGQTELSGAVSWSGDSGGPLLMDQDQGQWKIAGVLSKATCGLTDGDTAWYTNMHTYRDWFNTLVDPTLGAVCGQTPDESDPPSISDFIASFVVTSSELVIEAEVRDRSQQGLENAHFWIAPLNGTECSTSLADAPLYSTLNTPEDSSEVWTLTHRLFIDLARGDTACIGMAVTDKAGNETNRSITRVTRCLEDCHGQGTCLWTEGVCECDDQWSGATCEVCTPICDGVSCGEDGCGGQCGLCNTPPPSFCLSENVGETDDGLSIFGANAQTSLVSHVDSGTCDAGMCVYERMATACPELLDYRDDAQEDYGCLDGRCLDRCELIDHPTLDFTEIMAGGLIEPSGFDRVYVRGTPTSVPYFCPEQSECAGSVQHMLSPDDTAYRITCTDSFNVTASGQVWAQCGNLAPAYPSSLEIMLICVARDAQAEDGVSQLPYVCPESGINYSPNSGYYTLDCTPPFPVEPCTGRVSMYIRAEFDGREGPYIANVLEEYGGRGCE